MALEQRHGIALALCLGYHSGKEVFGLDETLRPGGQLGVKDLRIRPLRHLRCGPGGQAGRSGRAFGHFQPGRIATQVGALTPDSLGEKPGLVARLGRHRPGSGGEMERAPRTRSQQSQVGLVNEHDRGQLWRLCFGQDDRLIDTRRRGVDVPGPELRLGELGQAGDAHGNWQLGAPQQLLTQRRSLLIVSRRPHRLGQIQQHLDGTGFARPSQRRPADGAGPCPVHRGAELHCPPRPW